MRTCLVLAIVAATASLAAAQEATPVPVDPGPVTQPDPSPRELPPITINVTNNNTNTNTNTNTNPSTNTSNSTSTSDVSPPPVLAPPALGVFRAPQYVRSDVVERHAAAGPRRWLVLGITASKSGPGLRASVDLLRFHHLELGVAGEVSGGDHDGMRGDGGDGGDRLHGRGRGDGAAAVGYLAWVTRLGPLDVRLQAGAGAAVGERDRGDDTDDTDGGVASNARVAGTTETHAGRLTLHAEAALLLALPLTRRLGLVGGPVVSNDGGDDVEVKAFAGLGLRF